MLGLVPAEEAGRLDFGGGASRELLVETDDTLHADGIGSGADGLSLRIASSASPSSRLNGIEYRSAAVVCAVALRVYRNRCP